MVFACIHGQVRAGRQKYFCRPAVFTMAGMAEPALTSTAQYVGDIIDVLAVPEDAVVAPMIDTICNWRATQTPLLTGCTVCGD